jgi:hypothetical protein
MSFDQPIPAPAAAPQSPNGEAAFAPQADAAREARRMERLRQLEVLRERADIISAQLCNMIQGKLPPDESAAFAHINDPTLAFTRVCTAIRRMVALEERIDEDAETRAERLAAEAAKRAQAEAAAQIATATQNHHDKIRVNRSLARKALLGDIRARDTDMSRIRRELLLNDLTDDLDDLDYTGDIDALIAGLRKELDTVLEPPAAAANDAARSGTPVKAQQPSRLGDLTALIEQTRNELQCAMLREAER